jgi:predicted unusual protein kinase regulating ubiquinone biosynthesis (AarF/ABC1/UbiB family)
MSLGLLPKVDLEEKVYRIDYSLPSPGAPDVSEVGTKQAANIQQYSKFFVRTHPMLKEEHKIQGELNSLIKELTDASGLPEKCISVSLFKGPHPEAFILHHKGEAVISDTLLEMLDYRKDLVLGVLGHELGHVLLRHEFTKKLITQEVVDPAKSKINNYEHEYQSDRIAAILLNRLGYSPGALKEALERINAHYTGSAEEVQMQRNDMTWVVNSHPFISRRVIALERLSRFLPGKDTQKQHSYLTEISCEDFESSALGELRSSDFHHDLSCYGLDKLLKEDRLPNYVPEQIAKSNNFMVLIDPIWGQVDRESEEIFDEKIIGESFLLLTPEEYSGLATALRDVEYNVFPIDYLPEEVNEFAPEDKKGIDLWWEQSAFMISSKAGCSDIISDISEYSPEACRLLLKKFPIRKFLNELIPINNYETVTGDWGEEESMLRNSPDIISLEVKSLTSLLFSRAFEKEMDSIEGIERTLQFIQNFRTNEGFYLPYTNSRLLINTRDMFDKGDSEDKNRIVEIVNEYFYDMCAGQFSEAFVAAHSILKSIDDWLIEEGRKGEIFFGLAKEKYEGKLSTSLQAICKDEDAKREDIRKFLEENIPYNFMPDNLTKSSYEIMKNLHHSPTHDTAREADPSVAARLMDEEEFLENFYGKGRDNYRKTKYGVVDRNISELRNIFNLWHRAGYKKDLNEIEEGTEKVDFLLETLRAKSSLRDKLIAKSLGWKLRYVEDITNIQDEINELEDIHLISKLSESFSNDLLTLACSQRLWSIKENKNLYEEIPNIRKEEVDEMLSDVPPELADKELKTLLCCFPNPSYVRDDLLRGFIDEAPDEESTLSLSALLSEPPPGVAKSRTTGVVALSESLLDSISKLSAIDKQEVLLYLLGHNLFYSGISMMVSDSFRFGDEISDKMISERREYALYNADDLREKVRNEVRERLAEDYEDYADYEGYTTHMDNMGFTEKEIREEFFALKAAEEMYQDTADEDSYESEVDHSEDLKFIVTKPDAIILLSKASGIPVDVLFKQQRNLTTRREQRDLLYFTLFGPSGILAINRESQFLRAASETIVGQVKFNDDMKAEEKKGLEDLLSYALEHCPDYKLPDLFLDTWYLTTEENRSLPQLVAKLMQQYGSTLIKAGQYLSTQTTSLPQEWTSAFRGMTDQNRLAEKTLLYEQVYSNYGKDHPFKTLGRKLGEGSMAAVYAGELQDESKVAVKILHPNMRKEVEDDVHFLDKIVGFVNGNREVYKVTLPNNLAEVVRLQMKDEVSLLKEAENNKAFSKILPKRYNGVQFHLPKIVNEHSSNDFLVMEMGEGISLDDRVAIEDQGFDEKDVRSSVGLEIFRQILSEDKHQADPNLGNFKLSSANGNTPVVSWLDTGNLGSLDKKDRKLLKNLVYEVSKGRTKKLPSIMNQLVKGEEEKVESLDLINCWVAGISFENFSLDNVEKLFINFLDLCHDNGFVLEEKWVSLLRTIGLTKPLLKDVDPTKVRKFLGRHMVF